MHQDKCQTDHNKNYNLARNRLKIKLVVTARKCFRKENCSWKEENIYCLSFKVTCKERPCTFLLYRVVFLQRFKCPKARGGKKEAIYLVLVSVQGPILLPSYLQILLQNGEKENISVLISCQHCDNDRRIDYVITWMKMNLVPRQSEVEVSWYSGSFIFTINPRIDGLIFKFQTLTLVQTTYT